MIAYLAELGKLHFTEDEMKQMASEMTSIIEIMDTVKEIDIQYDAYADNKRRIASRQKRFCKML